MTHQTISNMNKFQIGMKKANHVKILGVSWTY